MGPPLTDSTGSKDYNQLLSERRAASLASYLVSGEVLEEKLVILGVGEDYPVASNQSPERRQLNRRVEITIVPLTEV